MVTCESRRPLHRVQLDGINSAPLALEASAAQRVYRRRVLGEGCTDCPMPSHCAVEGCGKHSARVLAYLKEVRGAMPVIGVLA